MRYAARRRVFVVHGVNKGQVPVNITGFTISSPKYMMRHSILTNSYTSRVLPGAYCEDGNIPM